MAAEEYTYRGYKLLVQPFGGGWKVYINAPGATLGLETIPNTQDRLGKENVLAEARALVDAELGS